MSSKEWGNITWKLFHTLAEQINESKFQEVRKDTTEAALRIQQRIEELDLNTTGSFRHSNGEELAW